jgi:hypothetical protein
VSVFFLRPFFPFERRLFFPTAMIATRDAGGSLVRVCREAGRPWRLNKIAFGGLSKIAYACGMHGPSNITWAKTAPEIWPPRLQPADEQLQQHSNADSQDLHAAHLRFSNYVAHYYYCYYCYYGTLQTVNVEYGCLPFAPQEDAPIGGNAASSNPPTVDRPRCHHETVV